MSGLLGSAWAAAPKTAEAAKPNNAPPDFAAFKLIYERNIFDPDRRPNRRNTGEPAPRPPRVESFTLRGTMLDDDKMVAIFDGTDSSYRTGLVPPKSIAGFRLLEVTYGGVKLSRSNQVVELPVLGQMRRQGEEDWKLSLGTASASASEPERRSSGSGSSGRFGFGSGGRPGGSGFGDRPGGPPSSARVEAVEPAESAEPAAAAPENAAEESSGGASDADAILKRLMEKREKE